MTAHALSLSALAAPLRRADRAWLACAALLLLLAVAAPAQAVASARFTAASLAAIAPYLTLAIAMTAYAGASGADSLVAGAFRGRMAGMIVLAAAFGALSPFCSCGVIPLIAALLSMGVPLPAVMAFWLSSPIMDPSMFVLTAATLGSGFAVGKTLAAIGIGLLGGFATLALQSRGVFAAPLRPGIGDGCCASAGVGRPGRVAWAFWREPERRAVAAREASAATMFLLKWLTLAFLIESLMLAYVPATAVAELLRASTHGAILLAVVAGVPAYLNGYAALPLVKGLLAMGVMPGAGMAFMVAGGVTSIPAAVAVYALVRRPVFIWYLLLALAGGWLSGALFQTYVGW